MFKTIEAMKQAAKTVNRYHRLDGLRALEPDFPGFNIWFELEGKAVMMYGDGDVLVREIEEHKAFEARNAKPAVATFSSGKYRGKSINQVPRDYVVWCAENANGEIGKMCREYLKSNKQVVLGGRTWTERWGEDEYDNIRLEQTWR
jgi:hypothetical protein